MSLRSMKGNSISELPAELFTLSGLQTLALDNNFITSIPADISKLSNLVTFSITSNAITSVAAELGSHRSITTLFAKRKKVAYTSDVHACYFVQAPCEQFPRQSSALRVQ